VFVRKCLLVQRRRIREGVSEMSLFQLQDVFGGENYDGEVDAYIRRLSRKKLNKTSLQLAACRDVFSLDTNLVLLKALRSNKYWENVLKEIDKKIKSQLTQKHAIVITRIRGLNNFCMISDYITAYNMGPPFILLKNYVTKVFDEDVAIVTLKRFINYLLADYS
jgi:hypothetical protein